MKISISTLIVALLIGVTSFAIAEKPSAWGDYAKIQLTRYGGYAPNAERTMVIKDFDPERDAYKLEVSSW